MKDIENVKKWTSFMESQAAAKGKADLLDVYLNAGLLAGKVADLLQFLKQLDIHEDE